MHKRTGPNYFPAPTPFNPNQQLHPIARPNPLVTELAEARHIMRWLDPKI